MIIQLCYSDTQKPRCESFKNYAKQDGPRLTQNLLDGVRNEEIGRRAK